MSEVMIRLIEQVTRLKFRDHAQNLHKSNHCHLDFKEVATRVKCRRLLRAIPVMASKSTVSQMLQQYRESQKKEDNQGEIEKIKQMNLEQLSQERISFGKAKLGQKFEEVFKDGTWTDWFVTTYEKSPKPQHQMYVQYVLKRLDMEMKKEFGVGYPKSSETLRDRRATASAESDVWDQVSEVDVNQEFEMAGTVKIQQVEEQMGNLFQENKNLASRINNIELTMQELLHHVRQLSVKSEP